MIRPHFAFAALLPVAACAAGPRLPQPAAAGAAPPLSPAVRLADPVVAELLATPSLAPTAELSVTHPNLPGRSRGAGSIAGVAAANRAAIREPARGDYLNAVQVYVWSPGALYRLYTAPGQVSDIALEPGEALVSVASGDTARWIIGDTTSGAGASQRTHILVKPASAGLRTNIVIATDRRMYHVEVESSARAAMAGVSWTYPTDALVVLKGDGSLSDNPAVLPTGGSLDFNYIIEGDHPSWRPIRAFDDGRQVYIEFPANLAQGEAPPLLVSATGGGTALVNYRVRGRYYVVDRLFSAAELRLGEGNQQVVRIVRLAAGVHVRPGKTS